MKIVRAGDQFVFRLGKEEQALFWELLQLYPCISGSHLRGSGGRTADSSQGLLEEALAQQRSENKQLLQAFLSGRCRLEHTDKGTNFSVSQAEFEWLLQILNEVRVGSWILLGSPEEKLEMKLLDDRSAPHFWAMEMAGHFEMQMLSALNE